MCPLQGNLKKNFLTSTYEEAHAKYVTWCDSNQMKSVPFGTFYRLKPNDVYSVCKIPENQCCCKLCQNFQLDKIPIQDANLKGIGSTTTEIVLGSLCPVADAETDVLPQYGYYNCIARNCKKCGKKKIFLVSTKRKY